VRKITGASPHFTSVTTACLRYDHGYRRYFANTEDVEGRRWMQTRGPTSGFGTDRTNRDVRCTVAIEGKADMARGALFGRD
jgi:hypothetical protein